VPIANGVDVGKFVPPVGTVYHFKAVPVAVSVATVAPELNDCALAVGAGVAFTVIVIVAVFEHCPAVGVNVYVVVDVLFNAGDQVPVMLLLEVVGKADNVAPEQIGATAVNVGVVFGLTVTVKVVVDAHCPAVGVNVYVVVVVLFNAGNQVPVIPLFDVVGKADNVAPEQIGATAVNVGVVFGLTLPLTATFLVVAPVETQLIFPDTVSDADAVKRT